VTGAERTGLRDLVIEATERLARSGDVEALARIAAHASQLLQAAAADLAQRATAPRAVRTSAPHFYVGTRGESGWEPCWRSECGRPRQEHETTGSGLRCPAAGSRTAPRLVARSLVPHAGHYAYNHPDKGHDLELWTVAHATIPKFEQLAALGVPRDATFDSGCVVDREQCWRFISRRPLSAGTCERCPPPSDGDAT